MTWAAAIGTTIALVGSIVSSSKAKKAKQAAERRAASYASGIASLEKSRQKIENPFEGVTSLAGMISNPYANLQVATGAAEMQAEEADLSLSSSLDTLRSTGASAGGATALAQAALRSKKGIAATIGQQEAQNTRLRAQGQAQVNQQLMAEAARLQQADVSGKQFMFGAREQREMQKLNRLSALMSGEQSAGVAYGTAQIAAQGAGYGAVAGSVSQIDFKSDRRLKKNIKLISYSNSGLKIYTFEYINKKFGKGIFQGVMSDEVPEYAVVKHTDGYDRVDYSQLDVEFKRI